MVPESGMCIQLWNVHFDDDKFSYTYLEQQKAIQSVAAFAELQIGVDIGDKDKIIATIVRNVEEQLIQSSSDAMCLIMIDDARIYLKRIIIDDYNPIVKALVSAMPQVNANTQRMISSLFSSES